MTETKPSQLYTIVNSSYYPWSCPTCGRLLGYEHIEPVSRARSNGVVVTHNWHVLRLVDQQDGIITENRMVGTGEAECLRKYGGCGEVKVWEWHR